MKFGLKKTVFCITPNISLWRKYPYIEPPFGSSLVVGGLRKAGLDVDYIDLNLQMNEWQELNPIISRDSLSHLEDWRRISFTPEDLPDDVMRILKRAADLIVRPDLEIAAFSLNRITTNFKIFTSSFSFAIALSHLIKKLHGCICVFGGRAMNKIGQNKINDHLKGLDHVFADYFFFDDGAIAMPDLLEHLNGGEIAPLKTDQRIYWHKGKGKIISLHSYSSPHTIEEELLKIEPSFRIFNSELYQTSFKETFPFMDDAEWAKHKISIVPYKFIYGCSNRCAFCRAAYDKLVTMPVEQVVDRLEVFKKDCGISCFRFFNSQINFTDKYANQFCDALIKRKLDILFSDSASLRNLSKGTCLKLREAGCVKLWFGLESPSDRILKMVDKVLTMQEARKGIMNAHEAGIWIGINIIVGFPHESEEEFKTLCDFIKEYESIVDCWSFSTLEVDDKTPMFDHPEKYGIKLHHKYASEERLSGHAFSEIGGAGWKDRELRSRRRTDECFALLDPNMRSFCLNDYLVFSLYRQYGCKDHVKSELKKFIKKIKQFLSLEHASLWMSPKNVDFDCSVLRDISRP